MMPGAMSMGIIVSNRAVICAAALGFCVSLVALLLRGWVSSPYLLAARVIAGVFAAALDYMQNGQLVGAGISSMPSSSVVSGTLRGLLTFSRNSRRQSRAF
jgi:hypothetical protein